MKPDANGRSLGSSGSRRLVVVYGTVVSTFLRYPDEIGAVTPAAAGALGSYALVGVLVGALLAGALRDIVGPRSHPRPRPTKFGRVQLLRS
jgi:hypothetical protein